jgi:hypothetical protein
MYDSAECSALVRSHTRKVMEAADALGRARLQLLAAVTDECASAASTQAQAAGAVRRSDDVLRTAMRLTATAERLMADARALLGECTSEPATPPVELEQP